MTFYSEAEAINQNPRGICFKHHLSLIFLISNSYPLANWSWTSMGRGWIPNRRPLILTCGLGKGGKLYSFIRQHQPRFKVSRSCLPHWSALDQEQQHKGFVWALVLSTVFENTTKLHVQYKLCHLNDETWGRQLLTYHIYTKSHPVIFNFLRKAIISDT